MDEPGVRALQRKTAAAAVLLLIAAFSTGILLGAAMSGKLDADVHEIVAAHLNAFLGCLWILALAFTLPMLRYGAAGRRRLVYLTVLPAYANWIVTTLKSFMHVAGVAPDHDHANDAVFAALGIFVVLPSFAAAIAWAYGLFGARSNE
jgi:hydroxylaminobenzene mutase